MEENWGNENKEQATQYDGGTPYGNSMYSNAPGGYGQPMGDLEKPMTMADWFLTLILGAIPCVGFVLYIYWAFASNVQKSKQNYCRVWLIFMAIVIVLYIILGATMMSMLASMSSSMY